MLHLLLVWFASTLHFQVNPTTWTMSVSHNNYLSGVELCLMKKKTQLINSPGQKMKILSLELACSSKKKNRATPNSYGFSFTSKFKPNTVFHQKPVYVCNVSKLFQGSSANDTRPLFVKRTRVCLFGLHQGENSIHLSNLKGRSMRVQTMSNELSYHRS